MYSDSAIVDLKAELSRKENELYEAKDTRRSSGNGNKTFSKIQEITGKKKKKHKKHKDKSENGNIQNNEVADETLQLLEKARHKLEAKAKIYEKMQKGEMEDVENIYGETKFLVDFQHKYYTEVDDDDKWLSKTFIDSQASSSLFEVDELHREKMRAKWEKEQEELLDGPVHYENVKFDEIRDLGTGYFAFSKDEEERKKQLEELQNLRENTKTAQNKKELLRNKRKAALQDRLDKVKMRKLGNIETEMEEREVSPSENCIKVELSNLDSGNKTNELVSIDKINDVDISNKTSEMDSSDKSNEMDSLGNSALTQEDEKVLQLCRKESRKERDWDKGKKSGFMNQIFVKSKGPYFYEKIIDERRDERTEQFAPPDSY